MIPRILTLITIIAVSSSICRAATVALDDGRILDGAVLADDQYGYLMNVNGMRVQIPRSKVTWFSKETTAHDKVTDFHAPSAPAIIKQYGQVETPEQPIPVSVEPAPAAPPVPQVPATASAPAPAQIQPPPPVELILPQSSDPVQGAGLKTAIQALRTDADPTNRSQALETIRSSGDFGLTALVEHGLYNPSPDVRAASAQLLGDLGGRRTLRYMIEAFYSAAGPVIPPYNREYVRNLTAQISRLSGQDFYFYDRRSNRAPEMAQKMVEWWNNNWDKVPQQLGEPNVLTSQSNYSETLQKYRMLRLEHREFSGVNLPLDMVSPSVPNTPAENDFVQSIPVIPRSSINTGQEPSWSHTPTVEKNRATELDYPGTLRRQEYMDKLREWASRIR